MVASGSWTPSLVAAIGYRKGERGRKATVITHPKYSQARSYTTYALVSMTEVVYVD